MYAIRSYYERVNNQVIPVKMPNPLAAMIQHTNAPTGSLLQCAKLINRRNTLDGLALAAPKPAHQNPALLQTLDGMVRIETVSMKFFAKFILGRNTLIKLYPPP